MRTLLTIISAFLLTCSSATAGEAVVKIANRTGQSIYFQSSAESGFNEIAVPDTTLTIKLDIPEYYLLIDPAGEYVTVYLTPGSVTDINVGENGTKAGGTNGKENDFIAQNTYICRAPKNIKLYSPEWVAFNNAEICRLDSLLDNSGLDPGFVEIQKLYHRNTLLNQQLKGLEFISIFNPRKETIRISDDYYDFLKSLRFDSDKLLSVPKWFEVANKAFEVMEREGYLPVSNDSYMSIHAKAIENENVRSAYLTNLLGLVLKKNYLNDFTRQLPEVKPMITRPEDIAMLAELEASHKALADENANIAAGTQMPDMLFRDVDKNESRLADYRGRYVILDFWYTGCAPCKAEMPYFDKLAREFDGSDVTFISLSVDTGDELYPAWEKMMREKDPTSKVVSVNLPDGFNSPLLQQLNIHGVPRIMLIDREGRIVESHAKRPSDPKLAGQLRAILKD